MASHSLGVQLPSHPQPFTRQHLQFPFFLLPIQALSTCMSFLLLLSTFNWSVTGLGALHHTTQNNSLSSFSLFKVTLSSLNLSPILLLSTSKCQVTALEVIPPWYYPYNSLFLLPVHGRLPSSLNLSSTLLQSTSNCQVKVLDAHPLSKTRQHLRFPFLILPIHGK